MIAGRLAELCIKRHLFLNILFAGTVIMDYYKNRDGEFEMKSKLEV